MTSAAAVDDAVSAAAGFEAAAEVLLPAFEDFGGVTTIKGKERRKSSLTLSSERGVEVEVADEATDSASNSGMLMTGPSNGDSSRAGVLLAGERSRGGDRPRAGDERPRVGERPRAPSAERPPLAGGERSRDADWRRLPQLAPIVGTLLAVGGVLPAGRGLALLVLLTSLTLPGRPLLEPAVLGVRRNGQLVSISALLQSGPTSVHRHGMAAEFGDVTKDMVT